MAHRIILSYLPLPPNLEKELQTFRSEVVLSVGQIVSCLFWPLTPYNLSGAGSSSAREAQDVWIKIFQEYNSAKNLNYNIVLKSIAKGKTDPRVEFISKVITQILTKQFQNFD